MELAQVYDALTPLRAPLQRGEYDLHRMVREALMNAGLPAAHEVRLAPRCRIDLMCGDIGIEIKRGKPVPATAPARRWRVFFLFPRVACGCPRRSAASR